MKGLIFIQDLIRSLAGSDLPLPRYPFIRFVGERPVVFVHIPKTAGSSIARALDLPPASERFNIDKHYLAEEICGLCGKEIWEEAFKFTCVRNPWDRLYSHYKYRSGRGVTDKKGRAWDFNSWGKSVLTQRKLRNFRPQVEWIKPAGGYSPLDRIIRFEDLERGIREISQEIDQEIRLPHLLRSPHEGHFTQAYDSELKALVSRAYAEDIERFGYVFREG